MRSARPAAPTPGTSGPCRVTADGRRVIHGSAPSPQVPAEFRHYPYDVDDGAAFAIPGPLPGAAG
jgi:hypothetical protein